MPQWSPPEIRMQNDARGVNHRAQRIPQYPPQLRFDCTVHSGERDLQPPLIEQAGSNFQTQPINHASHRIRHGRRSVAGSQRRYRRGAKQFVNRRQLPKQLCFSRTRHSNIGLCHGKHRRIARSAVPGSQRVHVSQQVLNLFLAQGLAVAGHFFAA